MVKDFDLNGWTQFSERRNSQSYFSTDKKWMVKFGTDVTERSVEDLEREQSLINKAVEFGVKTPKVSDIVKLSDGRLGLIYQYIDGKKSIARAISEDLDNLDSYMKRFARSIKDMHSKVCDPNKMDSWERRINAQLPKWSFLTSEQQEQAKKLMDKIEKKTTFIHGDCHTGNVIITATDEFVIDLESIACGNPIYDVGDFYFFTHIMPYYVTQHIFHCEEKYIDMMWRSFVKYYFGVSTDNEIDEISKAMVKYAILSFHGNFEYVDPTPDIKVFTETFQKLFPEAIANENLIKL